MKNRRNIYYNLGRSICCSLIVNNENDINKVSSSSSSSSSSSLSSSSSSSLSSIDNKLSNNNNNNNNNDNNDNININIITSPRTPYIPKNSTTNNKDSKKNSIDEFISNWVIISGFSKYSSRQDVIISLNEIKFETIDAMIDKYSNLQGFIYYLINILNFNSYHIYKYI